MAYYRSLQALRGKLGVEEEMRFIFESGSDPDEPYRINAGVVGDLFRVSDLMLMPSRREGFAMPVLEAGLAGIPAVCTEVPAAAEIGGEDVILFDLDHTPERLAERLLAWAEGSPVHRLRHRVRQGYTWRAIFRRDIEPLLRSAEDA
jgi:glycosyltransferase involved in cell wall biosynthesis